MVRASMVVDAAFDPFELDEREPDDEEHEDDRLAAALE